MKILNISARELLKNKLYFLYFSFGLALLLAVVCVIANYSEQVFDSFFTQFRGKNVMPIEMCELPRESRFFGDLPIYARDDGLTYNVTAAHGEKSVFLPSYRGGICVISDGKGFKAEVYMPLPMFAGDIKLDRETILPSGSLTEELGCETGDLIELGGREYRVGKILLHESSFSFIIYDPDLADAEEFTVVLRNKDQLLDIAGYLNSENFTDTDGILAMCEGFRAMRLAMKIVLILLAAVCAAYIFVFIKMYLAKRGELLSILYASGIRRTQLFGCIGAVFAALCFIGSALGFLISILFDRLVDKWAGELLGMHVDKVNYLAYFAVGFAASLIAAAVSLLVNLAKRTESEAGNR